MAELGAPANGRASGWLPGLVLGTLDAFVLLELGVIGCGLALASVLVIAWKGPRLSGLAGFLIGLGAVWTALLGRVALSCLADAQLPGEDCDAPLIGPWLTVGVVALATGLIASVIAVRRSRRLG